MNGLFIMLTSRAASCLAHHFTLFDGISFDLLDSLDLNEAIIAKTSLMVVGFKFCD